jgi:predicted nucleic acid-binding protein
MILVVDASVAIKWFVEEPLRSQARKLLADRHEFVAPDLLIAEVSNIA